MVGDSKVTARNPMWAFVAETRETGQAYCQHPKEMEEWKWRERDEKWY